MEKNCCVSVKYKYPDFFPCSVFLPDFSLCQDRLSGDASELGAALLCISRAGSVYVAVIQKLFVTSEV